MKFKNKSSVSSSGVSFAKSDIPDVADVPDLILEALSLARAMQDRHDDVIVVEAGRAIENLLRPALAAIAAAAEQLAEVV